MAWAKFPHDFGSLFSDMSPEAIGGLLKPYNTTAASMLAHAREVRWIKNQQYTDSTFPIMFQITTHSQGSSAQKQLPLVVSIYEDHQTLKEDIKRIFSISAGHEIKMIGIFQRCNYSLDFADLTEYLEPLLRILKMDAGGNSIVVEALG